MQDHDFSKYGLSTPALTLEGIFTPVRVVDVYDGDTLTVVVPFKGDYFKYTCRMMGIDTCEMKSKIKENKETAIRARNRVLQLLGVPIQDLATPLARKKIQGMLNDQIVVAWLHCFHFDKYGRLLADVHCVADKDSKCVSKILIEEKLAYEYFGETKLSEEQQADHM